MKIIYYGYSKDIMPKVIAFFHLGLLENKDDLDNKTKASLYFSYNRDESDRFTFLGQDDLGNDILILGCYHQEAIIKRMLRGFKRVFKLNTEILFVDTASTRNLLIKVSEIIAKIGFERVGNLILRLGLKLSYNKILKLVAKTKERTRE